MSDRRLLYRVLGISFLIHLLLLLVALLIPVMNYQQISEYIELSYGLPDLAESATPNAAAEDPKFVGQKATEEITPAPKEEPKQTTPEPPPTKPKKTAASEVETTPVKIEPVPIQAKSEEKIVVPKKKFDASERFKNQQKSSSQDALSPVTEEKKTTAFDDNNDTAITTTEFDTEKGLLAANIDDGEKTNSGLPAVDSDKSSPTPPAGNTNLPVIISDLKGRRPIHRPFPKQVEGLTRESTIEFVFLVAPDGSVSNVRPVRRGDPVLQNVSIDALKKWRFNPVEATEPLEVKIRVSPQLQ